jgi:hypothetical protein
MNIRHLTLAIAAVIAFPVAGHAQESNSTITRAQVRAELVQLEGVGYRPNRANDPYYPADIQAAEAAVAAQKDGGASVDSGVGGTRIGSSASGIRVTAAAGPTNASYGSLFAHH